MRIQGSRFRVEGIGFRFWVEGLGSGVQGLGFGVWISIFQVRSVGMGFQGPGAEIYLQDLASGLGMEVYSFFWKGSITAFYQSPPASTAAKAASKRSAPMSPPPPPLPPPARPPFATHVLGDIPCRSALCTTRPCRRGWSPNAPEGFEWREQGLPAGTGAG